MQHTDLVSRFEACMLRDRGRGWWISKSWLKGVFLSLEFKQTVIDTLFKDWRLKKPKMHVLGHRDPLPDCPRFKSDVYCEHGRKLNGATHTGARSHYSF